MSCTSIAGARRAPAGGTQHASTTAALVASLTAVLGCSSPTVVVTDVPGAVRWAALSEVDDDGQVVRSGPLARWAGGQLPVYAAGGRDLLVQGYGLSEIAEVAGDSSADEISAEPLTLAPVCVASLPPPLWTARIEDAAIVPATNAPLPRLTASWIDASCARPDALWVDTDCLDVRCAPVFQRSGCSYAVDVAACGFDRPRATLGASGELCVDFTATALSCGQVVAPRGAAGASSCGGGAGVRCTLSWYTAPQAIDAIERRFRLDAEERTFRPVNFEAGPVVGPGIFAKGYAWDLAATIRGAMVSTPGRVARDSCDPNVPSVLNLIDATSGAVTTATAPPCLLRLATTRNGSVIGVYVEGGNWWLGHFDADGRQLRRAPADPRPSGDATAGRPTFANATPTDLVRGPTGYVVLWRSIDPGPSQVFRYDDALQPYGRVEIPDRRAIAATPLDDGTIAVTTNESGELIYANPADGSSTRRTLLTGRSRNVMIPAVGMYSSMRIDDGLLVSSGGPPALHTVDQRGEPMGLAIAFDEDVILHATSPIPWDPRTIAVLGVTPSRAATLSLYDPVERHFLPGTRALSEGAASRIASDGASRLWILLPWTGDVVLFEHL